MTRTATTKLVATALAVASLGLASTAQAKGDVADPVEPTPAPTQVETPAPAPAMPAEEEAPAAETAQEEEEIDYSSPEYFKSDEAKKRFEETCVGRTSEPSHNDKKFCEDFKKHNGTTTTTTTPGGGGGKTTTTGGGGKYEPNYEKPSYEKPYYKPVHEAKKAMGKELPYTGLEMWQLGLIGIVLSGGGLGARRMLAS